MPDDADVCERTADASPPDEACGCAEAAETVAAEFVFVSDDPENNAHDCAESAKKIAIPAR